MTKREVTKEEYRATIDEILQCRNVVAKAFDPYTANAIDRLIMARIKIEQITIKKTPEKPKEGETQE